MKNLKNVSKVEIVLKTKYGIKLRTTDYKTIILPWDKFNRLYILDTKRENIAYLNDEVLEKFQNTQQKIHIMSTLLMSAKAYIADNIDIPDITYNSINSIAKEIQDYLGCTSEDLLIMCKQSMNNKKGIFSPNLRFYLHQRNKPVEIFKASKEIIKNFN